MVKIRKMEDEEIRSNLFEYLLHNTVLLENELEECNGLRILVRSKDLRMALRRFRTH